MEIPTYDRLLDVAQNMVQTNGFNAFSYGGLSRTVGIKTSSIHYHFPNKEDLGEALAVLSLNCVRAANSSVSDICVKSLLFI